MCVGGVWRVSALLWRCWNIMIIKCCYILLETFPVRSQTADCAPLFADHDSGRQPLSFTAVKLFSFTTAPPPRYAQLWPGGGAVTVTLWLVTQDKWLTLLFCACFFLICCDDEAVLLHSLAAAGEVLSGKFALLCQLSSKMSLCAPKTLRSYDSNINTQLIEIFLFPRQMEVNVVKKRHRTRSKGVRGEFVRFLLFSPSHFLKDPNH